MSRGGWPPVAWRGPIVMNTTEELRQAYAELSDGTFIKESVILPKVRVGKNCLLQRCIIDKGTVIPDGFQVGGHVVERLGEHPQVGIVGAGESCVESATGDRRRGLGRRHPPRGGSHPPREIAVRAGLRHGTQGPQVA